MALQLIGAALLMVNYDGSPLGKYAAKQVDIWEAQDEQMTDYMSGELFDDAPRVAAPEATPVMGYRVQNRIFQIDGLLGYVLLLAAVCVLLAPHGVILILIAVWFAANAWASMKNGGDTYTDLSLPGQAVRFLTPITLLVMQRQRRQFKSQPQSEEDHTSKPRMRVSRIAEALLRVAVASVFLVHGAEAFLRYWGFQDLILASAKTFGISLSLETTDVMLMVIGVMDIALALLLLVGRLRLALIWMACWALIAAFSRMTAMGWEGHPETLLRMLNAGAPLALAMLWIQQGRSFWPRWPWTPSKQSRQPPA